jgi:lipid II:glycine glycyltransferase (peptidoglycan interpeptide bridge formation enzyme)
MAKFFVGTDEEWDKLIVDHVQSGAVLQSSLWARVQHARGNSCVRILDENGAPTLWVSLPIMPLVSVWFCPKGPLVLPPESDWSEIVELLQSIKHATVLRVEPPHGFSFEQGNLNFVQRRDVSSSHTLMTKILPDTENLFKTFHEKTRYNIRVAEKHGIVVKKLSADEVVKFEDRILSLYTMTGSRHEIAATPREDLRALFSVCDVWAAFSDEDIIATSMQVGFGKILTYLHGASDYERRSMMAPYALHWAILQDAALRGFELYDWWGVAPSGSENHRLAGVTRFKMGFGGEVVDSPGTFDASIDPARFALYTALRRLRACF